MLHLALKDENMTVPKLLDVVLPVSRTPTTKSGRNNPTTCTKFYLKYPRDITIFVFNTLMIYYQCDRPNQNQCHILNNER